MPYERSQATHEKKGQIKCLQGSKIQRPQTRRPEKVSLCVLSECREHHQPGADE